MAKNDAMDRNVQRIKGIVNWTEFPNMEDVFRHRPAVNFLWCELVEFIRLEQETGYGDLDQFPKLQAASQQFMKELPFFVNVVIQNRAIR
jgi:hypothetical protein